MIILRQCCATSGRCYDLMAICIFTEPPRGYNEAFVVNRALTMATSDTKRPPHSSFGNLGPTMQRMQKKPPISQFKYKFDLNGLFILTYFLQFWPTSIYAASMAKMRSYCFILVSPQSSSSPNEGLWAVARATIALTCAHPLTSNGNHLRYFFCEAF